MGDELHETGGGGGEEPRGADAEAPAASEPQGVLRSFAGLFLVPLLVVVACVAVFVGFGWVAYDRSTTGDFVNDLRSGLRPRRAQAAYELSKVLVADPDALDDEPGLKEEVRRLFLESKDVEIRGYLALVLGHTGDREALPTLVEGLREADSQTRIYILWAMGAIGDPDALPIVEPALADPDPGIRKTAAFAVGQIASPAGLERLLPLLEDPVADVRWNAAIAVARMGSDASVPVLERMLDRRLTSQVEGITAEQQQETMIGAIAALGAVRGSEALPLLARLERDDPSLKVRQAAIEVREAIERPPGAAPPSE